jgi:hypothetical protein
MFNVYNQGFTRGVQVGCSPPLENFLWKKSQRGDQGKNSPPPRFFKKFKRKPQRGDQRIFWLKSSKTSKGVPKEIFWTEFRNVSQKCFLWSPLWCLLLKFSKIEGGGVLSFTLVPLLGFFPGGTTPPLPFPLVNSAYN